MRVSQINNKSTTFKRFNIHILDGGVHGKNMEHFAKAVMKSTEDVDIKLHSIKVNKFDVNLKQMSNLEETLKELVNSNVIKKGDYLTIPGVASVPLLNLQDRIKAVLNQDIKLTPQNVKTYKPLLMNLLKEFYNYKYYYSEQIGYMDNISQDLAFIYGVIREINGLVQKGVNVYIPAGHGSDLTVKWMAERDNLKNDLYYNISHGRDNSNLDNNVKALFNEAATKNYYNFNLLALSDANVVNVKDFQGKSDYIFSAYDSCVNDGTRGVYNFYPIRDKLTNEIKGYSYQDCTTVEYPYNEFPEKEKVENLNRFVGKQIRACVATREEHSLFKKMIEQGKNVDIFKDKLFSIIDIYDEQYIKYKKLDLLGHLIDSTQSLIFDGGSNYEVQFQKCNCEGSARPSVMSMWGSCFSTINAIKRDILKEVEKKKAGLSATYYIFKGNQDRDKKYYSGAEYYYNKALEILHPNKSVLKYDKAAIDVYEKLLQVLKQSGDTKAQKAVTNMLIDIRCNEIKDLSRWNYDYVSGKRKIANLYDDMAEYCAKEKEYYPQKVCKWAANELRQNSSYSDTIVKRRIQQDQYIGDLYNECN